jgi:cytochrome c551/c552
MSKRWLIGLLAAALSLSGAAGGGIRAQQPADTLTVNPALAERGKTLFTSRGCLGCHTIGRGKTVGPDLKGVTTRRSLAWIRRMIRTPDVMLKDDSTAQALLKEHGGVPMPKLSVTEEEAEALIQYIASQSRE